MLNRLLRFWQKLSAWVLARPVEADHRFPVARPYQSSNLHARHH
ncbi:MAG TPA: hypothetical protein VHW09_24375 [Bryobacteraceae bacterium]|nr:hypothetical protein [Bryobacteraceae bacterium]